MLPPGFKKSALAKTFPDEILRSLIKGVFPISSKIEFTSIIPPSLIK
jgi:hypothetical protein